MSVYSTGLANGTARLSTTQSRPSQLLLAPGSEVVVTRSVSPSFPIQSVTSNTDTIFRKDEIVRVTGPTTDPAWYTARNANQDDGLVHVDFVRPSSSAGLPLLRDPPMPWFHANISRETTERLLKRRADGTFLVRESTNFPGDYTLSIAYRDKVEHYRIYQANDLLTCDHEEYFTNLTQLVSHYKRDADGLCHRLVTPVICESRSPTESTNTAIGDERVNALRSAGLAIPRARLQLGQTIGHGEFGDVLLGIYQTKTVAVKVLKGNGNGMLDSLLDEATFMMDLRHPNLVALVGVVLDEPREVFMVTEFMANGSLVELLRSRGRHQLSTARLLTFAIDICQGMRYMESMGLVHRDLAARNILLDEDFVAKVSDFGLARKANSAAADSSSGKFPIKWTAPEALRQSKFSSASDMWSFGVLLWEIFSFGRVPYPRIPIQDVVKHIERGYRMEPPEGCPTEISRVMGDAWALTPSERPTFAETLTTLKQIALSYPLGETDTL